MNKHESVWSLQDAKAQLSELIRRVEKEGAQVVSVHGRKKVKVIPYVEPSEIDATGAELVKILEKSPLRDLGEKLFERSKINMMNRPVEF